MKCKQAEKIITNELQPELDTDVKLKLESHLSNCPKCLSFIENYNGLRFDLNHLKTPSVSEEITEQTKMLCHKEILRKEEAVVQKNIANETPLSVWVAFAVLLGLFLAWALPVLNDYVEDQVVTKYTIFLVMIIVQNIIALIFAPVLLRILKLKKISISYI